MILIIAGLSEQSVSWTMDYPGKYEFSVTNINGRRCYESYSWKGGMYASLFEEAE